MAPIEPAPAPYVKEKTYWAKWKGKDLVDALKQKTSDFYQSARMTGLIDRWIISYAFQHGTTPNDMRELATMIVGFTGNELERVRLHINLSRSYNRHVAIMALGEKPAFKAKTINSDHRSLAKAELSDRIVNGLYSRYYEQHDPEVADGEGFAGACGTHTRWDFKSGDEVTIDVPVKRPAVGDDGQPIIGDDGKPVMENVVEPVIGDDGLPVVGEDGQPQLQTVTHPKKVKSGCPYVTVYYPWSRVSEVRASGADLWTIVREQESKWNLIGQFGEEYTDDILRQNTKLDEYDFATLFRLQMLDAEGNKDLLTVQHFYHARCAAMPEGRYVVLCGDVILWDGPCPTKEGMPVSEMRSSKFVETNFPYADSWDIISINQALNQCTSDELQNLSLFARQSTYSFKGSTVTYNGLTKGTHFELPPDAKPPGAIQLATMPPTNEFKAYLNSMADRILGQSGTTRGEPDANVRSGEMAALLDSISIRYQSFRQQAARFYRIRNAQIVVDMISRYGETPFLVDVAGIEDRSYVLEFTKDDLSGVQRIDMDVVSPMMQTVSGRAEWAKVLLQIPDKTERAAMHDFVITGDVDAFLARERSSEQLVRRENEKLILGSEEVVPNFTDDPMFHIPRHKAAIERLQASDNPDLEAIDRLRMHILRHEYTYLMEAQPLTCQHLGIMPPPPIGPSQDAPMGNAAWRFQMQLQSGMPMPMMPLTPSGTPAAEAGMAPAQGQGGPAPATSMQSDPGAPGTSGTPQVNHPAGTQMPQPSTPPAAAAQA